MVMRLLALLFNRFPVRWQRRFMTAAHERFLVGVAGLGVDAGGNILLARHRFGAPQWRLLGGVLHGRGGGPGAPAPAMRAGKGPVPEGGARRAAASGAKW